MRLTAHKADAINRMGARLRETLRRCDPDLPKSLRLITVQVTKEALTRAHLGHSEIYPGIAKMARWGKCSDRQARRHARQLEAWGVLAPVCFQKGGRHSTRYWFDHEALIRAMMLMDANPHPDLMAEIRDNFGAVRADIRADTRADIWPDTCPPVSRRDTKPLVSEKRCEGSRSGSGGAA